ncbi:type II toxin-antitoxin system YafQ family toxin [Selenomonas sp. TAMA-11512]|uniref:type II toxin-antitoxin system YafQ family toxin n=1 Tax=Selenomonas sp. TAMA-11512 TaxID=3095337 RepID=UPI0030902EF1|nr:type II toxin-antitoxin system YafQ family toxin [Selenomonas sp. TAMA-11512]
MTYRIKFTTAYKKSYKRAKKRGLNLNLLDDVVEALGQGHKLDAKYRDHALHGNCEGFRECHIHPDWLLVYLVENDILTLPLIETGTHADIFDE